MFSISRIHQVLQPIPRDAFARVVGEHAGDRYAKHFFCWDQLVVMVYAQLAAARSLRELQQAFNANAAHHYHLGVGGISRSTLADANDRRPAAIYAQLLRLVIAQAGRRLRRQRSELLYLIDASCLDVRVPPGERRGIASAHDKWGMKLHLMLEAGSASIAHASVTRANVNDLCEARKLPIEPQATYVFDKGYCDYNWWARIDAQGARFVTRFKRPAALKVLTERTLPADAPQVVGDSIVAFATRTPRGGHRNSYSTSLRRIQIAREGKPPLVLATNDLHAPALEIAQLYKDRWAIELLFKWVKQHLQIRHFLGTSDNAVRIQVFTALIAYMLVLMLKAATNFSATLWMLLAELRQSLFQRPALEASRWRRRKQQLDYLTAVQPKLL